MSDVHGDHDFHTVPTTQSLLNERGKTHGSFKINAERSQHLKALWRQWGYDCFSAVKREALDAMALKFSRIFSGQEDFKDHWDDIAGYATLAANELDE